jgi:hypothetical protein
MRPSNNYFVVGCLRKTAIVCLDPAARNRQSIEGRRFRKCVSGFSLDSRLPFGLFFRAGDILAFTFEHGPVGFSFEGLCLSIRNRGFGRRQTSLIVRNIVAGVGIEVTIAYFLRRLYKLTFSDYKRKQFFYNRPRLYYLRNRINQESRVRF